MHVFSLWLYWFAVFALFRGITVMADRQAACCHTNKNKNI
jgi:hypothetical protein